MRVVQLRECVLSERAQQLVEFDMDSIRQVVASGHGSIPEVWLTDPDLYEQDGRILRDSSTARLLAYSSDSRVLYVTDGCNSCSHKLPRALTEFDAGQLRDFSERSHIGLNLLGKMARECAN